MLSFNLASCKSLEFRLKSYGNAEERIYGSISQEMCRKFLVHIKYLKFWTLELYSLLSDSFDTFLNYERSFSKEMIFEISFVHCQKKVI